MLPKESLTEVNGRVSYRFPLSAAEGVTYYFAVTAYDSSGYETDFSNEVHFTPAEDVTDTTPPMGSIVINGGDSITNSLDTILTLSATDDGKELDGNALMILSNDGESWSTSAPYVTGKIWTLSPGNGEKTVYAKFCDAAGNWMAEPVQDRIYYEESDSTCADPQNLQPVSVTASSELLPRYSTDNVIDGNSLTAWSALSLFKRNQFITLDLGAMKKLIGLSMYASKIFGTDFFPTDFQIEVSKDNNTWARVGSEWDYTPPYQPPYVDKWEFNGIDCRYVMITITKSKTLFLFLHLAQIAEIEVYGCDIEDDIPLVTETGSAIRASQNEASRVIERVSVTTSQEQLTAPGRPEVRFE
jgi:hypothetical protein